MNPPLLRVLPRPAPGAPAVELVRRGALVFRVYRQVRPGVDPARPTVSHTLAWTLHGRRHRVTRARREDLALAIEAAEIALANGDTARLDLTSAAAATYHRCLELAGGLAPLEALVAEAVEARRRNQETRWTPRNCPDIVQALLDAKRAQGKVGVKWLRALSAMLARFAAWHTGPLHLLRAADLHRFLDGLKGGLVYRRHHRAAVQQLVTFAQGRDWCPRDWDELKYVEDPAPPPVRIQIWTPDLLARLLAAAQPSMVPFLALQAFAGLRHEEIRPSEKTTRKIPLDWADFDWERQQLHIGPETGKTGERIVPIGPALVAWLQPVARKSGPVVKLSNTSAALTKLKVRAGLPHGRGQSRNVLRKSWISYRIGLTNERARVAEEAGTSLAKIQSNYRRAATEADARAWFAVRPPVRNMSEVKKRRVSN